MSAQTTLSSMYGTQTSLSVPCRSTDANDYKLRERAPHYNGLMTALYRSMVCGKCPLVICPAAMWSIITQGLIIHRQYTAKNDWRGDLSISETDIKWSGTIPTPHRVLLRSLIRNCDDWEDDELCLPSEWCTVSEDSSDTQLCLVMQSRGCVQPDETTCDRSPAGFVTIDPLASPEIQVEGTPKEWQELHDFCAARLPSLGLDQWFQKLVVPLKSLHQMAECRAKGDLFTQSMITPYMRQMCRFELTKEDEIKVSGWCTDLFPYLARCNRWIPNPNLGEKIPAAVLFGEFPTSWTSTEIHTCTRRYMLKTGITLIEAADNKYMAPILSTTWTLAPLVPASTSARDAPRTVLPPTNQDEQRLTIVSLIPSGEEDKKEGEEKEEKEQWPDVHPTLALFSKSGPKNWDHVSDLVTMPSPRECLNLFSIMNENLLKTSPGPKEDLFKAQQELVALLSKKLIYGIEACNKPVSKVLRDMGNADLDEDIQLPYGPLLFVKNK